MADIENQTETNKVGYLESIKNKLISALEVERDLKIFFILLCVGCGLIALSCFFVLTIFLNPKTFVSLFSLGSIVLIGSFIFLHGTKKYFEILFEASRVKYTIIYLICLVLGFIFSAIKSLYFASLIISIILVYVTIIFVLSFIPGGKTGISFMFSLVKNPFARGTSAATL